MQVFDGTGNRLTFSQVPELAGLTLLALARAARARTSKAPARQCA